MLIRFLVALSVLSVGAGLPGQSTTEPEPEPEPEQKAGSTSYRTHAKLSAEIVRLVSEYAGICSAESIATRREGRSLWALRLRAPTDQPWHRPDAIGTPSQPPKAGRQL